MGLYLQNATATIGWMWNY